MFTYVSVGVGKALLVFIPVNAPEISETTALAYPARRAPINQQ